MSKDEKEEDKSEATLEALRIKYTDLKQDEFILACGLTRSTYNRWKAEKKPPRLTPEQIVQICKVCEVSIDIFFQQMGSELGGLAQKKPSEDIFEPQGQRLSKEGRGLEADNLDMAPVKKVVSAAKSLNVPLKALLSAFGIDTTGIPDDCSQGLASPGQPADQDD